MKVEEALILVNEKIAILRKEGYKVSEKLASDTPIGDEPKQEVGELAPKDWKNVNIETDEKHGLDRVFELEQELRDEGIEFDTGTWMIGYPARDWEIDFSLSC